MRTVLQIGEVAQLLGVTTKTIRHYHKVGLLREPERSPGGYRLYSAKDLWRLRRIRHLQTLGLSLKQIRLILGESIQPHSLREILQALDGELAAQIQALEQRRAQVRILLEEDEQVPSTLASVDAATRHDTVLWLKNLLGSHVEQVSPQAIELDAKLWSALTHFQWPADLSTHAYQLITQFTEQPGFFEWATEICDRLLALEFLSADAPEVDHLVEVFVQHPLLCKLRGMMDGYTQTLPSLESPYSEALQDLMQAQLSPALLRFFSELERRFDLAGRKNL